MANKRVSFERKIQEIVDLGKEINISKVDNTDKYLVLINSEQGWPAKIGNDLWRVMTDLYNNL